MKTSRLLAAGGAILFLASLWLPAVSTTVLGRPAQFAGWQASMFSLALGVESAGTMLSTHKLDEARHLIPGLAALMSILFVITPAVLGSRLQSPSLLRWLSGAVVFLFALGSIAPSMLAEVRPVPLAGYYLWMLAVLALLAAVTKEARST
jgi:hypothetical protein